MGIVLKNSIKNLFGKPFRTLLVVFTIFMCCVCALLSFDMGSLMGRIVENYYGNLSRADFMVSSDGRDVTQLPEGSPECDVMSVSCNYERVYKDIDGEYCYVTSDYLSIYGVDIDEAVSMEFLDRMELRTGEIYITSQYAEDFEYKIGDEIVLHDKAGEEVTVTVGGIFPKDIKNVLLSGYAAITDLETSDMLSCGYREAGMVLIDVTDDTRISEAKDLIKAAYPGIDITDMFLPDSLMTIINEITLVFYLLFAATVLLVIFVTSSICNRIVSERMSYIGTLRSLGMSSARTAAVLLLENVLYALIGAVPAAVLYTVVRNSLLDSVFSPDGALGYFGLEVPHVALSLCITVVVFAVLIECLIPLKAILKALKTSIRDIIFDNRDTAYRFSRSSLVVGLVMLAFALLFMFLSKNLLFAIACLIFSVAALALLFPRLLRLVTAGIRKISDKADNSAWSLAAVEAVARKSTVGSGVLCTISSAMCIVVITVANAMFGITGDIIYDCDVVAECNDVMKYYTYVEHLEGVTDVEPLYRSSVQLSLGEEQSTCMAFLYGLPEGGFRYYTEFENLPSDMTISDNEIIIDSKYAERKGISVGDTITVVMEPDRVLPLRRTYTVAAAVDGISSGGVETFIVTQDQCISLFCDRPNTLLIKCDDPDNITEMLQTYGKDSFTSVKTYDTIVEETASQGALMDAIINTVIIISIGMTAIGVASNLLIGFEGRKKECAVLLSTAMSKKTLSGILFKEVLITSLTASTAGVGIGVILLAVITRAMESTDIMASMDMNTDIKTVITFFIILTVVFTGTVLFPIRNLKKMKITEQIKYE